MIPTRRLMVSGLDTRPRVLVPILMGQMARPMMSLGDALAAAPGASGNVLALVEIRSGRDNEVFAQEQRRRDMLHWVAGLEYTGDVRRRLTVTMRMTANVASSIRDAVAENGITSLVLEWPTVASKRRHGLTDVTRQLLADRVTDTLFVRAGQRLENDAIAPRSIVAAIRGGAGARVVARSAAALADAYGSVLTLLHIQTQSQHPDRSRREWQSFEEIVGELHRPATIVTVRRHSSAAVGILEEGSRHDLVIIGSRADPSNQSVLIGRDVQRVVRHLDRPVVMIRPKQSAQSDAVHHPPSNGHRA